MPSRLEIFDFDGTLFDSPADTPKNREKYERATGLPWLIDKEASRRLSKEHGRHVGMRRGWWGRPETLEPPLVPDPAPREWFKKVVCDRFLASKADPEAVTLIVTGRFTGLKDHVLRILHDGGLVDMEMRVDKKGKRWPCMADENVGVFCLGMDYHLCPGHVHPGHPGSLPTRPKPADTFGWKVWLMEQILSFQPEIKTVEIWEDREEHVAGFRELHGALAETVVVHHVP